MVAVSANVSGASSFGISPDNVFGFWDWVGGRYSVTSAVGVLPLSLQYGFAVVRQFLDGAASVDRHWRTAPLEANLPVLMGLLGVWNSTFLERSTRAILPYAQALLRFPAHVQQLDMESNGKRVALDGRCVLVGVIASSPPPRLRAHRCPRSPACCRSRRARSTLASRAPTDSTRSTS